MPGVRRNRIIDSHLHLSPLVSADASVAASALDRDLEAANVERAVVVHLIASPWSASPPWSAETFAEALTLHPRLKGFVNVNPVEPIAERVLRNAIEKLGFIGLKLHPRLQRFPIDDPAVARLVNQAGEMNVPVLIDAFPDGDWLLQGFHPLAFAKLAKQCPETRIILGHFGGHYCIDFMMLAKRIPNIWFDLSYSLLYYRGSGVVADLLYCCRSMKFKRIFYGSDYPDRPIDRSVDESMEVFAEFGIKGDDLDALLWRNAIEFFGWSDL